MSKLLDELVHEICPDIPKDAVTVVQLMERGITRAMARKTLLEKWKNSGWTREWYGGKYHYWKP